MPKADGVTHFVHKGRHHAVFIPVEAAGAVEVDAIHHDVCVFDAPASSAAAVVGRQRDTED